MCVREVVSSYLESPPFHSSRTGFENQNTDCLRLCREGLADLFNCSDPNNILFTSGATESLNLAINGLDLNGGHVITSTIEHNSVIRPLKRLEEEGTIELSFIGCDQSGFVDPDDFSREIRSTTKAIIVNHCSNVTGAITDIEAIADIASRNGLVLIVDTAQSAGSIAIDVESLGIDMLIFTGHKSLYGLPGIGGIYISGDLELRPMKVGGTGVKSELLHQPPMRPLFYEAGTPNLIGIMALGAGVEFIRETGLSNITARNKKLTKKLLDGLSDMKEIKLYGTNDINKRSSVVSFTIDGFSPADAGYMLENSFEIIIRSGLHCAPLIHKTIGSYPEGSVRVSPSFFTTDDEIDLFLEAVHQMMYARALM